MKMGLYYSQAQDWDDPNGYVARKDNSQKNFRAYLDQKCLPQIKELLTQYGDIALLWFDTPMETTEEESREIVETVKKLQPDCIVSGRIGNGLGEYMTTGDNFIPAVPFEGDWEVPATLNDTWGYSKFDHAWKNSQKLIRILLKINARGGNYLLNIGPKADGSIPGESVEILDQVGGYGVFALVRKKYQGEDQLSITVDKDQYRLCRDNRFTKRKDNPPDDLQITRAINPCRLIEPAVNAADISGKEKNRL